MLLLLPAVVLGAGRRPSPAPDGPTDPDVPRTTVREFARTHGFTRLSEDNKHLHLRGRVHTLVLPKGGRKAILNDVTVWLNRPVALQNREWSLADVDIEKTLRPTLRPAPGLVGLRHQVIVLDPGHGGDDVGAESASGVTEKAVCLDIALRARRHLVAAGYSVHLTRHQDSSLTLEERVRRTDAWNADVFVSVHANAGGNAQAKGIETFLLALPGEVSTNHANAAPPSQLAHEGNRRDAANMSLSYALQKALLESTGAEDRGIRRARFSVLRDNPAPAALVEVGFLTNPEEAAKLSTAAHRERLGRALANGIELYLTEVRRAAVLSSPSTP